MRKICILIFLIFLNLQVSWAIDTVTVDDAQFEGKIEAVSSDFIVFKKEGVKTSFARHIPMGFYEDNVIYHPKIFSKEIKNMTGRIHYMDSFKVQIRTPQGLKEIPRYRVKEVMIKIR